MSSSIWPVQQKQWPFLNSTYLHLDLYTLYPNMTMLTSTERGLSETTSRILAVESMEWSASSPELNLIDQLRWCWLKNFFSFTYIALYQDTLTHYRLRSSRYRPAFSHSDLPLYTHVRPWGCLLELIPALFRWKAELHPGQVTCRQTTPDRHVNHQVTMLPTAACDQTGDQDEQGVPICCGCVRFFHMPHAPFCYVNTFNTSNC